MRNVPAILCLALCGAALAFASGCIKQRRNPTIDLAAINSESHLQPVDPIGVRIDSPPLQAWEATTETSASIIPASHGSVPIPSKPKKILALSGGGMFGAYTAGVLNGWTRTGSRPQFDVITGISTGGLIAPLVFAGEEYDDQMTLIYTRVTRRDIFTYRNWATVPFRESVASTAPLRGIVTAGMTDEIIIKIAAEHRKGRRLYIGTTNLDTRRFVTWDIGAIATRCETGVRADIKEARDLIIDILIASCSLPGVFPPVPIDVVVDGKTYTELHADGGVISSVWVPTQVLDACTPDPTKPLAMQTQTELYVILAGKSYPNAGLVGLNILEVMSVFLSTAQCAQNRGDVSLLYHQAKTAGMKFFTTAVPADFSTPSGGLEFDSDEMNRLYDEGFRIGSKQLWWRAPVERGTGEIDPIRTNNRFRTRPGARSASANEDVDVHDRGNGNGPGLSVRSLHPAVHEQSPTGPDRSPSNR